MDARPTIFLYGNFFGTHHNINYWGLYASGNTNPFIEGSFARQLTTSLSIEEV